MTPDPAPEGHGKPLCGAPKRQGPGTCRRPAGWGTDHVGVGTCKLHLGNTLNHRKNAADRKIRDRLAALNIETPRNVEPAQALLDELARSTTWVAFLEAEVSELDDVVGPDHHDDEQVRALVKLWNEERDRKARFAKMAIDGDVAERFVRVSEAQAERVVAAMFATLEDAELLEALADADMPRARRVAGRHLRALSGNHPIEIQEAS